MNAKTIIPIVILAISIIANVYLSSSLNKKEKENEQQETKIANLQDQLHSVNSQLSEVREELSICEQNLLIIRNNNSDLQNELNNRKRREFFGWDN